MTKFEQVGINYQYDAATKEQAYMPPATADESKASAICINITPFSEIYLVD